MGLDILVYLDGIVFLVRWPKLLTLFIIEWYKYAFGALELKWMIPSQCGLKSMLITKGLLVQVHSADSTCFGIGYVPLFSIMRSVFASVGNSGMFFSV